MNNQTSSEPFSVWLRRKRLENRLTQGQLAKKAGISPAYISHIERERKHTTTNAKNRPDLKVIDALATSLNEPLGDARTAAGYAAPVKDKPRRSVLEEITRMVEAMTPEQREIALDAVMLIKRSIDTGAKTVPRFNSTAIQFFQDRDGQQQ